MGRAQIYLPMVMCLRACTTMANRLDRASTSGRMAAFISVNFKTVSSMDKVSGVSVSTPRIATCMRVTTKMTKRMGWASSCGSRATTTRAVTRMTSAMAMVRCTGRMALATRESGSMAFKMELDAWSSQMGESKRASLRTIISRHPNWVLLRSNN